MSDLFVRRLARAVRGCLARSLTHPVARPGPHRAAGLESLEGRLHLSVGTTLGVLTDTFVYNDVDGDQVTVILTGAGTVDITLNDNAVDLADLESIVFHDTDTTTQLNITVKKARIGPRVGKTVIGSITGGTVGSISMINASLGGDLGLSGSLRVFRADAIVNGADFILGSTEPLGLALELLSLSGFEDNPVDIAIPGGFSRLMITNAAEHFSVSTNGNLSNVNFKGAVANARFIIGGSVVVMDLRNGISDSEISVAGDLDRLRIYGDARSLDLRVGGAMSQLTTSKTKTAPGSLINTRAGVSGAINNIKITGGITDSILSATEGITGLTTGAAVTNTLLLAGTTLDAELSLNNASFGVATIERVTIGGDFTDSILAAGGDPGADRLFAYKEVQPGGKISKLIVKGIIAAVNSQHPNPGIYAAELGPVSFEGRTGPAVIDPLPSATNALTTGDIESIIEHAIAQAQTLGVNATISVTDREGNVLGVVRMDGALADLDGLIATAKAATAAILSNSNGGALTTRSAAQLLNVESYNLPTSDVYPLPLGVSTDPGGVPLYRNGELLGAIGVEADGENNLINSKPGSATHEEKIALAGQIGFVPKSNIRADKIRVDGVKLSYANASNPRLTKIGVIPDLATLAGGGAADILTAPRTSPASRFALTYLNNIHGEAPNNALNDFYNDITDQLEFLDGDSNGGEQLTADDVHNVLLDAHAFNQSRGGKSSRARLSIAVVDFNGHLLGAFLTTDAPVFSYDLAAQRARAALDLSNSIGSIPLYKNGQLVGAIGVAGYDATYDHAVAQSVIN